ncbi:hypothetical protein XOCgx_1028 [Xanthomonas oryzae pv. oryzicola]|nr:hypothetical protein XOCgx_1028 [Xanthomonas oryzae pv. oryzicola]
MNDITAISAKRPSHAQPCAGARGCLRSAIVRPRFVQPVSVCTAG